MDSNTIIVIVVIILIIATVTGVYISQNKGNLGDAQGGVQNFHCLTNTLPTRTYFCSAPCGSTAGPNCLKSGPCVSNSQYPPCN